jgi:hypothetical protein
MNAIRKCRNSPSAAVFAPPWNDLGPSSPEATDWKIRIGGKWFWIPQAMQACVISRTPHAIPPHKIARKGLGAVVGSGVVANEFMRKPAIARKNDSLQLDNEYRRLGYETVCEDFSSAI